MKIASMKKAMPSSANGRPMHVAVGAHELGPQQAHLEAEDGARHGADGEQHGGDLRPALGQTEGDRVVVAEAATVDDPDHRREGHAEAGEHDVPSERQGHLPAGGQERRGLFGSQQPGDHNDEGTVAAWLGTSSSCGIRGRRRSPSCATPCSTASPMPAPSGSSVRCRPRMPTSTTWRGPTPRCSSPRRTSGWCLGS